MHWTRELPWLDQDTSAGDMVQNVFNNDEWGLSVEIILGINSNTAMCHELADFRVTLPIWRIITPVEFESWISLQLTLTYQKYTFLESWRNKETSYAHFKALYRVTLKLYRVTQ